MSLSSWVVRHVTYPTHERLRGRPTLRALENLRAVAAGTPRELRDECNRRLHDLLIFAAARLPYYASLLSRCRIDLHADDPVAELRKVPVQTKADVRAHARHLVWRGAPGGALPHSSGGTTGDTLQFYVDRVRQAEDLAARLFMQSRFGLIPGDRRLHLWGSPIELRASRFRRWRDRALNELLLNAFEMSPEQMDAHFEQIVRFQPQAIYGYPTALALLAQHIAQTRGPQEFNWLKLVVLTGEEVTPDQARRVRETFGCPVAAEYGSREVGLIGHDCPRGRMHVLWPHIHVDIGNAANILPAGHVGDVICTTLNTRAQPFIRYRLGDLGAVLDEPCECGLPFPLMRLAGGKITGFIALPDGRLCHGAITSHVLRDQRGIVAFKTHQHTLTEFEVLLVVDDTFNPASFERIRQRYRRLFGEAVNVDCRVVDEIPPDPSGKRRYVVSDVAPSYQSYEVVNAPG